MPIFKHDRDRYPVDWREISLLIRDANDWQCQACGQQCRRPGEAYDTQRRTLTVAHWNSVYDSPWVLLVPLCCPCHLRHDAVAAWVTRRRTLRQRRLEAGQMSLIPHRDARLSAFELAELERNWPNLDDQLQGIEEL